MQTPDSRRGSALPPAHHECSSLAEEDTAASACGDSTAPQALPPTVTRAVSRFKSQCHLTRAMELGQQDPQVPGGRRGSWTTGWVVESKRSDRRAWEKPLAAVLLQKLGETLVLTMMETGQGHQRRLRPAKPPGGRTAPKTEGMCTCWWGPCVTELGGLSSGGLGDGGRSSRAGVPDSSGDGRIPGGQKLGTQIRGEWDVRGQPGGPAPLRAAGAGRLGNVTPPGKTDGQPLRVSYKSLSLARLMGCRRGALCVRIVKLKAENQRRARDGRSYLTRLCSLAPPLPGWASPVSTLSLSFLVRTRR